MQSSTQLSGGVDKLHFTAKFDQVIGQFKFSLPDFDHAGHVHQMLATTIHYKI